MNTSRILFIVSLLFAGLFTNAFAAENDISVKEAHQMATNGDIVLIDVRSVEEWEQTGIAINSHPISIHQKGGIQQFTDELLTLLKGNKAQPIALICAGGVRSARVQNHLKTQGFKVIYNVKEGMVGGLFSQGWIQQGLPTVSYMSSETF